MLHHDLVVRDMLRCTATEEVGYCISRNMVARQRKFQSQRSSLLLTGAAGEPIEHVHPFADTAKFPVGLAKAEDDLVSLR